jgi:hypothetical protein
MFFPSAMVAQTAENFDATSAEKPSKTPDAIAREMVAQDSALSGAFTAHFQIDVERDLPLGPDRGRHSMICKYAASDGTEALSVETQYEADPVYQPPGTPWLRDFDFDHDGNLIVGRTLREVSLFTADFNRTYQEEEKLRVSPKGKVVDQVRHVIVFEYPVGKRESLYHFDQFRMVAGRGFTTGVERLKPERTLPNGLEQFTSRVDYGSGSRGDWHLYVNAQNGNLVRQADMFFPARDRPSIHVENSGVIEKEGLALARDGTISYSIDREHEYVLQISVVDFSARADLEQLERIRAIVTPPFPPGTEIMDKRISPARRYPAPAHSGK